MNPDEAADFVVKPVEDLLGDSADQVRSAVRLKILEAIADEREECALQIEGGPLLYEATQGLEKAVESARTWLAAALRRRSESFARQAKHLERS